MSGTRLLAIVLALPAAVISAAEAAPPATRVPSANRALLVGCSTYPNLEAVTLEGSVNDVALMRDLLIHRFGFLPDNVVTLSEAAAKSARDESRRPTRTNIERQFALLAEHATPGSQVVILMSGHGTQIPAKNPADPDDFEPDGLDEMFLCADARPFDSTTQTCPGGIVDNELGTWVRRIRDRGAYVWVVMDCCHSGTILRGNEDDVVRRVPVDKLVSREALQAARGRARGAVKSRGGTEHVATDDLRLPGNLKHIAVFYAAQAEESTIELPLPHDSATAQKYGLLTYTLSEVLQQARGQLTYRELAQRVQASYLRSGRTTPTPFLEGEDRNREVLGLQEWPHRSAIHIVAASPEIRIDAGSLHGLTQGSIIAVLPADAPASDKPIGYANITRLGSTASIVQPSAYASLGPVAKLPVGSRCEVVYLDYGLRRLKVFGDVTGSDRGSVDAALKTVAATSALIQVVGTRRQADWVLHREANQLYLEPASGIDQADRDAARRFGPVRIDQQLGPWLSKNLERIARGQNLLAMARPVPGQKPPAKNVRLELVRLSDPHDRVGKPILWQNAGLQLHQGDMIGCRLTNVGDAPIDVTLLFVDSGYGITSEFPRAGTVTDNRLYPGDKPVMAFRANIDATTTGLEHLVLIALPGTGEPIDFSALEQPTLPRVRGDNATGRGLESPLGQLLQSALYSKGGRRGSDVQEIANDQVELISWRVMPSRPSP